MQVKTLRMKKKKNFKGGAESLQIKEASDMEELKQCNEETNKKNPQVDL